MSTLEELGHDLQRGVTSSGLGPLKRKASAPTPETVASIPKVLRTSAATLKAGSISKSPMQKASTKAAVEKSPMMNETIAKPPMNQRHTEEPLLVRASIEPSTTCVARSIPTKVGKNGSTVPPGTVGPRAVGDDVAIATVGQLSRSNSWQEFAESDPVYAMIGEIGEKKVVGTNGVLDEDRLKGYLRRLLQPGVVKKFKDWVTVWAAMGIPIEVQRSVVQAIIEIGLASKSAENVPFILAELIKQHRVKAKSVEEAIVTLFEYGGDQDGCLARLLLLIFPKSPTSEWGWSRVGWSWKEWWGFTEKVLNTLNTTSAYETLCDLLRALEHESGTYLPHQQIWDEKRLQTVREALCKYGDFMEDELPVACDVHLS